MAKRTKKIRVYDATKENATNPLHLCYALSSKALASLNYLVKAGKPVRADAYVVRHLVDKKLASRVPNGKKSLYKATFLGEAVIEVAEEEKKI